MNRPKWPRTRKLSISADKLHRRLGHIAPEAAARLVRDGFVEGVAIDHDVPIPEFCDVCVRAKKFRKPIAKVATKERASEFAEHVHSDVWGPVRDFVLFCLIFLLSPDYASWLGTLNLDK